MTEALNMRWEPAEGITGGRSLIRAFTVWAAGLFRLSVFAAETSEAADGSGETTAKAEGALAHDAARAMDAYGNSILRLSYSYLHNMEDAEDILQETLIRYIRKAPPFENERHERAWLLTVAANLSKNRIKFNRFRDYDELNEELVAEDRDDLSFVWEAVKFLPVRYREVIHLFYQEGYGSADIAAILGQKDATVRSNLKRGREKLRAILEEEYDFTGGDE